MTDPDPIEIHFISRVTTIEEAEDHGAAYRCQRCGYVCVTKVEMWAHRKGFLSHCFRTRVVQRWRELIGGEE